VQAIGGDPPVDWHASLEGFRRWGDDLLDRWDGRTLLRGEPEPIAVDIGPDGRVRASGPGRRWLGTMVVDGPIDELAADDPVIAGVAARHPGVRPVLHLDPLTAIIRSISAQQVNLRWACTTRRRLVEAFGGPSDLGRGRQVWRYHPDRLAAADPTDIRALQFTTRKAEYIVAAARVATDGRLDRGALDRLDDDAVIERLVALPGVGRWTAEWFLARTLGRPVVVAGDLGVRKAVGLAYCDGRMPSEAEVRSLTAHWGAAAGVAQQLLLHALAERTLVASPKPG
jgi:DNA-3-methyladenine glycosylase II